MPPLVIPSYSITAEFKCPVRRRVFTASVPYIRVGILYYVQSHQRKTALKDGEEMQTVQKDIVG